MQLHLHDGRVLDMPVHGNMTGLRITGVTFSARDVHHLLGRNDAQIRDFLQSLNVRFSRPIVEDWEIPKFGLTPKEQTP